MYGDLEYERANAIKLIEDIIDLGELRTGAEQYPNSWSVIDRANRLRAVLSDIENPCKDDIAICDILTKIWNTGLESVSFEQLSSTMEAAMTSAIGEWEP